MAWTLQSLIDGKMTVTGYCQRSACNHHQVLNLEKLRDRFGPDFPAMADDLKPKMRCTTCGGDKVGLTYSPAGNEKMVPKNAYLAAKNGR
jgi:hypothetical protein